MIGIGSNHPSVTTSYIYLRPNAKIVRTVQLSSGVLVDVDADGAIIGIESLGDISSEAALMLVAMNAHL